MDLNISLEQNLCCLLWLWTVAWNLGCVSRVRFLVHLLQRSDCWLDHMLRQVHKGLKAFTVRFLFLVWLSFSHYSWKCVLSKYFCDPLISFSELIKLAHNLTEQEVDLSCFWIESIWKIRLCLLSIRGEKRLCLSKAKQHVCVVSLRVEVQCKLVGIIPIGVQWSNFPYDLFSGFSPRGRWTSGRVLLCWRRNQTF